MKEKNLEPKSKENITESLNKIVQKKNIEEIYRRIDNNKNYLYYFLSLVPELFKEIETSSATNVALSKKLLFISRPTITNWNNELVERDLLKLIPYTKKNKIVGNGFTFSSKNVEVLKKLYKRAEERFSILNKSGEM